MIELLDAVARTAVQQINDAGMLVGVVSSNSRWTASSKLFINPGSGKLVPSTKTWELCLGGRHDSANA